MEPFARLFPLWPSLGVSLLWSGALACSEPAPMSGAGGGSAVGGANTVGGGSTVGGSSFGGGWTGGSNAAGGALTAGGASGGHTSGGASSSGGASALGGSPSGADWATTEQRLALSCANSICHGGTEKLCLAKDADRTGGQGAPCLAGTTLYGTLLSTEVEQCDNLPLINPAKPDESALVRLVTRQCGEFVMPANCPPEDQGYPTCWPEYAVLELSAWIAAGAPGP